MRTLIFVNKQLWFFVDHCFCVFCLWTFQRWSQSIKVQQHTAILKLSEAKVAQKTFWRHIINLRICWAAERGKVEFKTDSYISSDQRKRGGKMKMTWEKGWKRKMQKQFKRKLHPLLSFLGSIQKRGKSKKQIRELDQIASTGTRCTSWFLILIQMICF